MNTRFLVESAQSGAETDATRFRLKGMLGATEYASIEALFSRLAREVTAERLAGFRRGDGGSVTREAFSFLGGVGALGVGVPADRGGHGHGLTGSLAVTTLLAACDEGGLVLGANVQSEVACSWLLRAEADICETHLPRLVSGQSIACQCDTDPSADEPTLAEVDGDEIVVTGIKHYVVNGDQADLCFVAARMGPSPAIILIDKSRPGVSVEKVWDKLGTRSIDSASIRFDAVRVPKSHLLSRHGLRQMIVWNEVMSRLRLSIAAAATIIHGCVLDGIMAHASARRLGGRPLAAWPVNHHALSQAAADEQLMIAGVAGAVRRLGRSPDVVSRVAQLKWFCVERACDLARLACDLEGGRGYMAESRSLGAYKTLRGMRMAGGSQTTMLTIANHTLANQAETEPHTRPAAVEMEIA
ncbi:acyl-CoA dehydrogenase family protein [Jiella pacifica]|uniref:Acyl-CoA dehydrogenase n=1 Tax=Jiella pacifica TaxID=2696469 RepID=A0A6N9T435_9HYPH|nr:acyl-CoA dehydrogenase [Jiella pacifica]NDW06020.1 hypothetical protein [Jiella pacifica]